MKQLLVLGVGMNERHSEMVTWFGDTSGTLSKRVARKWSDPGERLTYMTINKHLLHVDLDYQREQTSREKVLKIAREFNWSDFGTLTVGCRGLPEDESSKYWIIDGGHRWRAALNRDDIADLPCMVMLTEGVADEAMTFVRTNTLVSNVSAFHRLRALHTAKDPFALKVYEILDRHGYRVSKSKETKRSVRGVEFFMRAVAMDARSADRTLELCAYIAEPEESIPKSVMAGVYYLISKESAVGADITTGAHREKLKMVGLANLAIATMREKHLVGKGGDRVDGNAILDVLNKGRRNKLTLP